MLGSPIRGLARTLRKVAIVSVVCFVALEISLRVFQALFPSPIFPGPRYVRDRTGRFRRYERFRPRGGLLLFPGDRLNAKGYHDVDRAPEPPAGMRRIVALGDSFAFGFVPRREGFLARIETSLSRAPRRVEVVNLGVPGIGVDGYEAELVDEGLGMHPDVVLVCFFIGNDFTDRLHPTPIAHSYVLDLVHWLRIARLDAAPHPYSDRGPTLSEADFLLLERNRLRLFDPRGRLLRRNLPWVAAHLARIRDRARRAGATMRVVVLPAEIQVDEVVRGRVLAAAHADPAALDWDAPNRALAGAMRDAGIPSLDVLDSFRAEARRTALYRPRDMHWNLAGNRLAASRIALWLAGAE